MPETRLHLNDEWPVFLYDPERDYRQELEDADERNKDPHLELVDAFRDNPTFRTAQPFGTNIPGFGIEDIDQITNFLIESNDNSEPWELDETIGTQLNMLVVGVLKDGRWFSGAFYNDYTGWGCQSGADFRVSESEQTLYEYGLDASERDKLGIELEESL